MKRSLIALACAVAFVGTSALAQQQDKPAETPSAQDSQSSGGSITERMKATVRKIGEKTKEVATKAKDKTKETAHNAKQDTDEKSAQGSKSSQDTRSMGASGSSSSSESERQKRMDDAYKDSQKSGHSSSSTPSR